MNTGGQSIYLAIYEFLNSHLMKSFERFKISEKIHKLTQLHHVHSLTFQKDGLSPP